MVVVLAVITVVVVVVVVMGRKSGKRFWVWVLVFRNRVFFFPPSFDG
jgi:uncharacterized membrane protein